MTPRFRDERHLVGSLRIFTRTTREAGDPRTPIVLVHGAVISGRYMMPLAERLAATHPVLVPDLPGYGRSEAPPLPLRVPELADALREWLDAVSIPAAIFVGNSLGTQVITALGERHPGRVAALALIGPTVDRDARARLPQLWRLAKDAFRERPSLIPLHLADQLRAGIRLAAATLDVALDDAIERRLPHVRAPLLLVRGSRDPICPARWFRFLGEIAPAARLAETEGPHALNYSRPDAAAAIIREWLAARGG